MAYLAMVNPKKRRARKSTKSRRRAVAKAPRRARRRRANPVARVTRRVRRRRNPISKATIMAQLSGALAGAGGAFVVSRVYGMLPVPAALSTGLGGVAGRAGFAILAGVLAEKAMGRKPFIANAVQGALTVEAWKLLDTVAKGGSLSTLAGGGDVVNETLWDFTGSGMAGVLPGSGPLPATGPLGAPLSGSYEYDEVSESY